MLGVKEKHTIAGMGGSEEVADRQTHIRTQQQQHVYACVHTKKHREGEGGWTGTPPPHTHTSRIIVMEVVVAEVDDIRELPFLIFNRP
jgi:hypothetical protein